MLRFLYTQMMVRNRVLWAAFFCALFFGLLWASAYWNPIRIQTRALDQLYVDRTRHLVFIEADALDDVFYYLFQDRVEYGFNAYDGRVSQRGTVAGIVRARDWIPAALRYGDENSRTAPADWVSFDCEFIFREGEIQPSHYILRFSSKDRKISQKFRPEIQKKMLTLEQGSSDFEVWNGQRLEKLGWPGFKEDLVISGSWPIPFVALPIAVNLPKQEAFYVGDMVRVGYLLRDLAGGQDHVQLYLGKSSLNSMSGKDSGGSGSIFVRKDDFVQEFSVSSMGGGRIDLHFPIHGDEHVATVDRLLGQGWVDKLRPYMLDQSQYPTGNWNAGHFYLHLNALSLTKVQTRMEDELGLNEPLFFGR